MKKVNEQQSLGEVIEFYIRHRGFFVSVQIYLLKMVEVLYIMIKKRNEIC